VSILLQMQQSPLFGNRSRNRLLRWGGVSVNESIVRPRCHMGKNVTIDDGCFLNYGCFFDDLAPISLGHGCRVAQEVAFITSYLDHRNAEDNRRLASKPITVGEWVWVGARAVILPGVTIGHHAIIGAGTVVTRDCEPWGVYVGSPARLVRQADRIPSLLERQKAMPELHRWPRLHRLRVLLHLPRPHLPGARKWMDQ
jgi:maltose O-acetyltransferase